MAEVQFRKSDASSSKSAVINIKDKYTLLRPGGLQVNGVVKSPISGNKSSSMCRSDPPHVNGIVTKEVSADEASAPKIQIDSADAVSLDWQKVSQMVLKSESNS